MRPRLRGLVISNCQAQPIKHILSLLCRDVQFDGFGVHLIQPEQRAQKVSEFLSDAAAKYDVVVSVCLSDEFGELSGPRIARAFAGRPVVMIPNFYFSGLHPDLTYIGEIGGRVTGPLSDYHSKLVILGYAIGFSPQQTVEMFCGRTYTELGYFDEYERSFAELRRRDAHLTVPFTDELTELLKVDLCFFSVNHPTNFLVGHFCQKLSSWLETLGITMRSSWPCNPSSLPNHLAQNVIFPVYTEIAIALSLSYSGSYCFKPATIGDIAVGCLELPEFVDLEFKSLAETVPPSAFLGVPRIRDFINHARSKLAI
jgi:hypothetical protein